MYPNLGFHYAAQAKLEANWKQSGPQDVLQHVDKAVAVLQVSSPDSCALREMMEMQHQLQMHTGIASLGMT